MALTKGSGFGVASASEAAAGGTIDIVAEGTVAKGISVILQSNGKIKTIDAITEGWGTSTYAGSGGHAYACHAGNGRIFVAWRDSSASNGISGRVGSIDGTTITWGSKVTFTNYYCTNVTVSVAPSTGHYLVAFTRLSNDYAYYSAGTIGASGTTITGGSTGSFRNSPSFDKDMAYDSKNNQFFLCMRTYNGIMFYRATATSNSSFSSSGTLGSTSSSVLGNWCTVEYDSTNERAILSWKQDNNNKLYVAVKDTSNNNGGTQYELGLSNQSCAISHDPDSGKTIFVYRDTTSSNLTSYRVGTVSGTAISFNSAASLLSSNGDTFQNGFTYDSKNKKHYLHIHDGANNNIVRPYTFDGTTLTALTTFTAASGPSSLFMNEGQDTVVYVSAASTAQVFQPESSTLTAGVNTNFIGLATADYSDGDTAKITVIGGVSEGHTGLSIGSVYYVSRAGTLSTTEATTSVRVGTAISSTQILLK